MYSWRTQQYAVREKESDVGLRTRRSKESDTRHDAAHKRHSTTAERIAQTARKYTCKTNNINPKNSTFKYKTLYLLTETLHFTLKFCISIF